MQSHVLNLQSMLSQSNYMTYTQLHQCWCPLFGLLKKQIDGRVSAEPGFSSN